MAGVSRSPTIVMAYLIKKCGMTAEEAIRLVQERRPRVENRCMARVLCFVVAFHKALRKYELQLKTRQKKAAATTPQSDKAVSGK